MIAALRLSAMVRALKSLVAAKSALVRVAGLVSSTDHHRGRPRPRGHPVAESGRTVGGAAYARSRGAGGRTL